MRIPYRFQRIYRSLVCRLAVASLLTGLIALAGCRPASEVQPSPTAVEVTPTGILEDMVQAYQAAEAYSDRGVLCLRYQQQGTRFHDEAALAVVAAGNQQLRVHAYQAAIVCDGRQLMAHVADPNEAELGRQVLLVPAPPKLSLDSLLADPILKAAVTGGAGRLPIQLELLLADEPLIAILPDTIKKSLLPSTRVEGHDCHGVEVVTDEGRFVFWIDKVTFLLRRLEYPPEVVPASLGASKPQLVAEFRRAEFSSPAEQETFFVSVTPGDRAVSALVVPPPPLESPLLGQRVTDFQFLNPTGADVTAQQLQGRVAVLLWFSDHPACQTSLQQVETACSKLSFSNSDEVAVFAVCAESSARSHDELAKLLWEWDVHLPMVRDLRAFGRDLFDVPGAPTLVVLDAQGVVQVYQVGANPDLADELPATLRRILQGEDVAAQRRAQYEADLAAFRAAIQ